MWNQIQPRISYKIYTHTQHTFTAHRIGYLVAIPYGFILFIRRQFSLIRSSWNARIRCLSDKSEKQWLGTKTKDHFFSHREKKASTYTL